MSEVTVLKAGQYRAEIILRGGGLGIFTYTGLPLVDFPPRDAVSVRGVPFAAGTLLAPWPNRVADGFYVFHGETQQLPINEIGKNTALHGFVREQLWQKASLWEAGSDYAQVILKLQMSAQPGWPWPMDYEIKWSLRADTGLTGEFTAINKGESPCPFGFGWHPYLSALGADLDECQLRLPLDSCLPLDKRGLPAGEMFSAQRVIPGICEGTSVNGIHLDHAFRVGDSGGGLLPASFAGRPIRCYLTRPDGHGVRLVAGNCFEWLQVYTADPAYQEGFPTALGGKRALAVEPMTCPPDMLRREGAAIILEPCEPITFSFGLSAI